jgi:hypothetical protein
MPPEVMMNVFGGAFFEFNSMPDELVVGFFDKEDLLNLSRGSTRYNECVQPILDWAKLGNRQRVLQDHFNPSALLFF